MENDSLKRVRIVSIALIVLIGLVVAWAYYFNIKNAPPAVVAQDVPLAAMAPTSWLVQTDTAERVSFAYPEQLPFEFHRFVNDSMRSWPPRVRLFDGELFCKTGVLGSRVVSTRTIDGRAFCVITGSEAGMSQLYSSYVYAFNIAPEEAVEFSFTVHSTNGCGVYDDGVEPNTRYKKCQSEQALFTPAYIDDIVAKMARSVKVF